MVRAADKENVFLTQLQDWRNLRAENGGRSETREDDGKVQKRHRSFGKREFKGGSPLAQSKGSTVVAKEGILKQLKD